MSMLKSLRNIKRQGLMKKEEEKIMNDKLQACSNRIAQPPSLL